ncbi:hypothetical protein RND81_07G075600 [Saponaria officinalis]|uniref:Uncharacterized protein n=1 Tax=Saponaria officinalis TaxID=3572 RepID=A0AAW1JSU2_SAPOF
MPQLPRKELVSCTLQESHSKGPKCVILWESRDDAVKHKGEPKRWYKKLIKLKGISSGKKVICITSNLRSYTCFSSKNVTRKNDTRLKSFSEKAEVNKKKRNKDQSSSSRRYQRPIGSTSAIPAPFQLKPVIPSALTSNSRTLLPSFFIHPHITQATTLTTTATTPCSHHLHHQSQPLKTTRLTHHNHPPPQTLHSPSHLRPTYQTTIPTVHHSHVIHPTPPPNCRPPYRHHETTYPPPVIATIAPHLFQFATTKPPITTVHHHHSQR